MAEIQQCQNGACDFDLDLKMRSKFRGHETSISTAAFCLATPLGGLLALHLQFRHV